MATSKDCNPLNLYRWAGLKGVSLVGTGDFTHPGWRQELREQLIPAEPGFYQLKEAPAPEVPNQSEARFVVTGELSTIYKKNGRVRKVHHLIILPSLEDADRFSAALEDLGMNIRSDGRPILGIDSYDLFQLLLENAPEGMLVPAHIWTPHFSVFGSNSGFDDIYECYADLTQHIAALETGLSSDPAMNWRWSALDRFKLISNSDAHNPRNLAREANIFAADFSYQGLKNALYDESSKDFLGTLEFFPEEGKYHYDGHRNCEVCWKPEETIAYEGICPRCGRRVTVGVLNRITQMSDRPEGFRPSSARPFQRLVPLKELIASALNVGPNSRKVEQVYFQALHQFGPELTVLREIELNDLAHTVGPLITEGIRRLRDGVVEIRPGYDGEYGVISVFREDDRQALLGQAALFEKRAVTQSRKALPISAPRPKKTHPNGAEPKSQLNPGQLSPEQAEIVHSRKKNMIIIAGPGTGKTKTLVERIAYLIKEEQIDPAQITGVTFTNKAAAEIRARLTKLFAKRSDINGVNLGTFHSLAWKILNEDPTSFRYKLIDQFEARDIVKEILHWNRISMTPREALLMISKIKNKYRWEKDCQLPELWRKIYEAFQEQLDLYQRVDFDDIILKTIELWETEPEWLKPFNTRFRHLLIDEFQDLNAMQYRLIQVWSRESDSFLAIGDPNQAIYGFRGASPEFFKNLQNDRPQLEQRMLSRNFRSIPAVITAANSLIESSYRQKIDESDLQNEAKLVWLETNTEKEAAKTVVAEIIRLLGGSTMLSAHDSGRGLRRTGEHVFGLGDIAILFRTGRQADALEQMLAGQGLPYRVVGQQSTFEAPAVTEFLDFLRLMLDPTDLFLLRKVLMQARWSFSGSEIAQILHQMTDKEGESRSQNWIEFMAKTRWETPLLEKIATLLDVSTYYEVIISEQDGPTLLQDWMERMGYQSAPEFEQLLRIIEERPKVAEFLEYLSFANDGDISRKSQRIIGTETITLSTLHASKGLEFPVVFIVGVEEGLLPYGEKTDPELLAEEQRLFYVGVTRAQQQLYFVNCKYRNHAGEFTPVEVSKFLRMIPEALLDKVKPTFKLRNEQLGLFQDS